MKAKKIIDVLDNFAPKFLIDDWDNTGFQVGDNNKDIKKVLISLDVDQCVLEFAIKNKIDMIISHHPLFFKPLESITNCTPKGDLVYNIVREDILIYNAHTNLDQTMGGVNDILASLFKLNDIEILHENIEKDNKVYGYGKVGNVESVELIKYIDEIKSILDVERITVFGNIDRDVERLAICGGSGASFIKDAYNKKADIYITGDIKYHDAQEAVDLGLTVIDAGHYHTEKVVLPLLKDLLEEEFKEELEIQLYMKSSPSYKIY